MKPRDILTFDAINIIRKTIQESDVSGEMFFVARRKGNKFGDVERTAMGNKEAVVMNLMDVFAGDIVIHNHPSGNLEPSMADIQQAAILERHEVGFYIVNDEVTEIKEVTRFARNPSVAKGKSIQFRYNFEQILKDVFGYESENTKNRLLIVYDKVIDRYYSGRVELKRFGKAD